MAHPLEQSELRSLQNIISKNIAIDRDREKRNRTSRLVSNKDKYSSKPEGGLDLRHFQHCPNISTVNATIRYLNNEGPDETNQLLRKAALNEENWMVLKLVSDACHSPRLRFNTTSSEINTPPHLLEKHEQAYVRFTKDGPYQDGPLLFPFHHNPSLLGSCSSPGSAFPQKIEKNSLTQTLAIPKHNPNSIHTAGFLQSAGCLAVHTETRAAGMYKNCTKKEALKLAYEHK